MGLNRVEARVRSAALPRSGTPPGFLARTAAVYPSIWASPVMWPDCPPPKQGLDGAFGGSPLRGANRVVFGGGQLGYLCCDAITCLSIG